MGEKQRGGWYSVFVVFLIIFFIIFTYAIIRYNVIKGVEIKYIPLYISNKAIAVTSVVLIGFSFLLGPLSFFFPKKFNSKLYLRKHFGLFGFGLAVVHSFISLLLFSPSYYPKFFEVSGKLSLEGELSMSMGILALFIFSIVAVSSVPSIEKGMDKKKWLFIQRLGYLAFFLVMLHVFVMGFKSWLKPSDWPGGLLPMSLIAFIVIFIVLFLRLIVLLLKRR